MTDLLKQAQKRAAKDLKLARVHGSIWSGAVVFLRKWIPHDTKREIREGLKRDRDFIIAGGRHFTWGMQVRNELRRNGFGEKNFEIDNMDNIYVELIREAL